MTEEIKPHRIAAELLRGEKALLAARTLLDAGLYEDAITRAYYAAFHFATAALIVVDVQPRSHRGLHALFAQHLIQPGLLPASCRKSLRRLEAFRDSADYDASFSFDREGTIEEIEVAEAFIETIRAWLRERGMVD